MSAGRYWMRLSNLLTVAASSSTVPASRLPRSRLTCAHTPSVALSSGGVGRQLDHGQPAMVRLAELAHRGAAVHVEIVPDRDDRAIELGMCGGDQVGVGIFGEAAPLPGAAAVHQDPVEQPTAGAGPV